MYLTQAEIHGGERKKNYIYFFYRLNNFTYEIIYKSQYTVLYVGPERGRRARLAVRPRWGGEACWGGGVKGAL